MGPWIAAPLLMLAVAIPVGASGPFYTDLLERDLAIQYVKNSYKIYRSPAQADRHRASMRRELHAWLAPRLPRIRAELTRAGRHGLALRPLSLALPRVEHDPSTEERLAPRPGPLTDGKSVNLLRTAEDVGLLRIVVLIAKRDYDWGTVNLHLQATLKDLPLGERPKSPPPVAP